MRSRILPALKLFRGLSRPARGPGLFPAPFPRRALGVRLEPVNFGSQSVLSFIEPLEPLVPLGRRRRA